MLEASGPNRDAIVRYVTALGMVDPTATRSWYFHPLGGTVPVTIESAPAARDFLSVASPGHDLGDGPGDGPGFGPIVIDGETETGLTRYRFDLGG